MPFPSLPAPISYLDHFATGGYEGGICVEGFSAWKSRPGRKLLDIKLFSFRFIDLNQLKTVQILFLPFTNSHISTVSREARMELHSTIQFREFTKCELFSEFANLFSDNCYTTIICQPNYHQPLTLFINLIFKLLGSFAVRVHSADARNISARKFSPLRQKYSTIRLTSNLVSSTALIKSS